MKKIAVILLLATLGAGVGFAQKEGKKEISELKNQKDSLSYAYGTGYAAYISASHFKGNATGANLDAFLKGLAFALNSKDSTVSFYAIGANVGASLKKDAQTGLANDSSLAMDVAIIENALLTAIRGQPTLLNSDTANVYLQTLVMQKQQAQQEKQFAEAKKAGETFLTENAKRKGVKTLPSGLQYEVIIEGKGDKATATDQVKVHYNGTLIDGTKFDSSYDRGEPATFGVTQVIPGWTEALQLMPVGSKWKIYIPQDLAYGAQGAGQQVPPFSTLVFDVELLEIVK